MEQTTIRYNRQSSLVTVFETKLKTYLVKDGRLI